MKDAFIDLVEKEYGGNYSDVFTEMLLDFFNKHKVGASGAGYNLYFLMQQLAKTLESGIKLYRQHEKEMLKE